MASPPLPSPLDHIASRPFSLFPAIVGIEHNEWLFKQATWSEILVANRKTEQEVWIPRRYLGQVSQIEEPVLILGLTRELEYKGGLLGPHNRRLINMPAAVGPAPGYSSIPDQGAAKPLLGLRLETSDRRAVKLVGIVLGAFILIYVLAVSASRVGDIRGRRVVFTTADTSYQELTPRDDRFAVILKLGNPAWDRFKEVGGIHYEALSYPSRKYTVLLMGQEQKDVVYIGTMDDAWKPVHSVALHAGGSTDSLLRTIQRF